MSHSSRRDFLKTTALLGGGAIAVPMFVPGSVLGKGKSSKSSKSEKSTPASERLNLAVVGLGGRGGANLGGVSGQNLVALCDVDDKRAGKAYDKYPQAKKFFDFRKMFDELESKIDGVVISTPDHTHFHPAWWALQRGKHVYLEKPLAHSVWEVRELCKLAAAKKVATQLGAQRHTLEGLRRGVEIVKSGALGTIKEVHSWVGSSRGMPKTAPTPGPVPASLQWDLWLGPAADRPYSEAFVPYTWRFWWDFGTGEAGNWGCHILDIPYWALGLKYPTKVEGAGPTPDPERTPTAMSTRFEFPATDARPGLVLHWHQGTPAAAKELGVKPDKCNNLFIGTKGKLLCGFDKTYKLLPEKDFKDYELPRTLPPSPGFYQEWFDACKGGQPATCNFDYAGPMAETVLLGNVAYRVQGGFDWDAANLKPIGNPAAEKLIRPTFRKGWEV